MLQKNFTDLKNNIACYFETNKEVYLAELQKKFTDGYNIPLIPTRFFKGFINSMSNIYKNNFTRVSNYPEDLQKNLDEEMIWCERYRNISKEALIYIKSEKEFQSFDPSEYLEQSKSLIYIQSGDDVLKFEVGFKIQIAYDNLVENFQDKNFKAEFFDYNDEEIENNIIKTLPFVFLRPKRFTIPTYNDLVAIEIEFICAISWGMYNTNPKMVNQVYVSSDGSRDELRESSKSLGKTTRIFVSGVNDKVGVIDMGDLKNLLDLFGAWKMILEQRALMCGVDKNSVFVQAEMLSGEAKKVEMIYINEVRKDNFSLFRNFEKKIAEKINELFGTSYVVEDVIYEDIALSSEDMSANIQEQKDNNSDNSDNSDNSTNI